MTIAPKANARAGWLCVYGAPIVIGLLSLAGLLSALLLGEVGHYLSWIGLGLPVAIAAWRLLRR